MTSHTSGGASSSGLKSVSSATESDDDTMTGTSSKDTDPSMLHMSKQQSATPSTSGCAEVATSYSVARRKSGTKDIPSVSVSLPSKEEGMGTRRQHRIYTIGMDKTPAPSTSGYTEVHPFSSVARRKSRTRNIPSVSVSLQSKEEGIGTRRQHRIYTTGMDKTPAPSTSGYTEVFPFFSETSDVITRGIRAGIQPRFIEEEKRRDFVLLECGGFDKHAVLGSPSQNTVRVIYSHTSKDFVTTRLTEELKARTGMHLMPLKTGDGPVSFKQSSVTIVIFEKGYGNHLRRRLSPHCQYVCLLRDQYLHPSVYTSCTNHAVMQYPDSEEEKPHFWDSLAALIGGRSVNLNQHAILNDFGVVQHSVLESPDHNTVHVICSHTDRNFVNAELAEELKTRTGLQLVPLQHRAGALAKGDGSVVCIVVLGDLDTIRSEMFFRDSDQDILCGAVKSAGYPDTQTLYLQKGRRCPKWVKNKLPHSTVMMYPASSEERPLFWDSLVTVMGGRSVDLNQHAILNDFGVVQHSVLESPDHNTVHVICYHTSRDFVNAKLAEELKTRTGLQLVPPQHRADALSKGDSSVVCIVVLDDQDSSRSEMFFRDSKVVRDGDQDMLRGAVQSAGYPDTQTLYLQKGRKRPKWVENKLPHCTVMMYPGSSEKRRLFWDSLATVMGGRSVDLNQRAILNDFGVVQYSVLESPDHNIVHVICYHTNRDFVNAKLVEELKTRTGLQLVPPQHRAGALSKEDSSVVYIVVLDGQDSSGSEMFFRDSEFVRDGDQDILCGAVQSAGYSDRQTIYLKKGRRWPRWVENKLPHSTVMMYPGSSEKRRLFWDLLATVIGGRSVDLNQCAILNDFGVVQHSVLESPDHNTAHVICYHTNRDFVNAELAEELKTRTGLQLVPPQHRVGALSKGDGSVVCIVVLDDEAIIRSEMFFRDVDQRILCGAVQSADYPNAHTLYLQKGRRCPQWVKNKLLHCTVMMYPRSSGKRSLFWDSFATVMGDRSVDLNQRAILNDFSIVQHSVLETPDHSTVHVIYYHASRDFVNAELAEELKTRTGLQLVPLQHRAGALSKGDSSVICIVVLDDLDSIRSEMFFGDSQFISDGDQDMLRGAVQSAGYPETQILYLQKGRRCPQWVENKLPHCTMMVYRGSSEKILFWDSVTAVMSDRNVDPSQCAMLNDFGIVQHSVLESPDHNTVHVICYGTSRDFVNTELAEELKTRTGLQLVPPKSRTGALSKGGSSVVCIFVLDDPDSDHNMLYRAVQSAGYPETQILCLQTAWNCPQWVEKKLLHCTMMKYPGSSEKRSLFWDSLTTVMGDHSVDLNQRAMLNNFGLVQHSVLESPDHNAVHVICCRTSRDFVNTELTEELKTRLGLQAVQPQKRAVTLSTGSSSVVRIVILDKGICYGYNFLCEAAQSADYPYAHILYVQKGRKSLKWRKEEFPPGTVIMYPGPSEKRPHFWDSLTAVIDGYHKHPPTQVTEVSATAHNTDSKNQPVKTERHTAYLDLAGDSVQLHQDRSIEESVTAKDSESTGQPVFLQTACASVDTLFMSQQLKEDGKQDDISDVSSTLSVNKSEAAVQAKFKATTSVKDAIEDHNVKHQLSSVLPEDRDSHPDKTDSPSSQESCAPAGNSVTMETPIPSSDLVNELGESVQMQTHTAQEITDKHSPDLRGTSQGICYSLTLEDSDAGAGRKKDVPPPVVSTFWQTSQKFDSQGGTLHMPGSDVKLHVPPDAVFRFSCMDVRSAVCADVDRIYHALKSPHDQHIVSPLAEFQTDHDVKFQHPVCITLPHCLPKDFEFHLVYVYCLSRHPNGNVKITRIRWKPDDKTQQEDIFSNELKDGDGTLTQKEKDVDEKMSTETDKSTHLLPEEKIGVKYMPQPDDDGCVFEEKGYFQVSAEGQVFVITDHFSGYVCTYCGHSQGPPEFMVMAYGSHIRTSEGVRYASVDLHIWDKRIEIADFRKEYFIGCNGSQVGKAVIDLLDDLKDTKFMAQMAVLGCDSEHWEHLRRSDGRPGTPVLQKRQIKSVIACSVDSCSRKKNPSPILIQWKLNAEVSKVQGPIVHFVIDFSHLASKESPEWTDRDLLEMYTTLSVQMQEVLLAPCEDGSKTVSHWKQLLSALSNDQLLHVAEILQIYDAQPYSCSSIEAETLREELNKHCITEGPSRFIRAISTLLSQTAPSQKSDRTNVTYQRMVPVDHTSTHITQPQFNGASASGHQSNVMLNLSHQSNALPVMTEARDLASNRHKLTEPPSNRHHSSSLQSSAHQVSSVPSTPQQLGMSLVHDGCQTSADSNFERPVSRNEVQQDLQMAALEAVCFNSNEVLNSAEELCHVLSLVPPSEEHVKQSNMKFPATCNVYPSITSDMAASMNSEYVELLEPAMGGAFNSRTQLHSMPAGKEKRPCEGERMQKAGSSFASGNFPQESNFSAKAQPSSSVTSSEARQVARLFHTPESQPLPGDLPGDVPHASFQEHPQAHSFQEHPQAHVAVYRGQQAIENVKREKPKDGNIPYTQAGLSGAPDTEIVLAVRQKGPETVLCYKARGTDTDPKQLASRLFGSSAPLPIGCHAGDVFDGVFKDIILLVASMLGKDGNEIFFFRLGLNRGQFDNAKSECGEDKSFDLLNYKCLSKWKETKGNKATVEELKKALKSIERQDIIEEIEKLERTNSVSDEGSEKMVAQAKEEV